MGTFNCPNLCPKYCKESQITNFTFQLTDLYPGLTNAERALASQFPAKALIGYTMALKAEHMCADEFGANRHNDESDGCRHFIWAGLMSDKIGSELATKFLNAHEDYEGNPIDEKSMDTSNNTIGLSEAKDLIDNKKFSAENLKSRFMIDLKDKKIQTIKPRLKGETTK